MSTPSTSAVYSECQRDVLFRAVPWNSLLTCNTFHYKFKHMILFLYQCSEMKICIVVIKDVITFRQTLLLHIFIGNTYPMMLWRSPALDVMDA